jgi:hypothetical protein
MKQVARNLTMEEEGILNPGQDLIHDRHRKCCKVCKQIRRCWCETGAPTAEVALVERVRRVLGLGGSVDC